MKKLAVQIVMIAIVIFLGYKVYESIMEPVEYKTSTEVREKVIKKKLGYIKVLEIEYKKIYGSYMSDFDTLIDFYHNDSMPMVMKIGSVPDTLTETMALELGIISRDTSRIAISDTLLKDMVEFKVDEFELVPFTHGKVKFEIAAGTVERANFDVPVFEIKCYKKDYLAEIKAQELLKNDILIMKEDDKFPGLKLGSLTEPSTDGNW
ncbi:MAG: hypothetical protein KAG84_01210 [Bacteroidales bacterium]|nr:hypothetical protein [Bacteroidales bacterium]